LSATLTSWREAVCASPIRRGVAVYAGFAVAALALWALLSSRWPWALLAGAAAALTLWLAFLWTVPWTVDGYRMRVRRLFRDMNHLSDGIYSAPAHAGRLAHELRRVTPPERWQAEHAQLLQLVSPAGARRDADLPLRERERRSAARWRGFDATLERFARDASTPEDTRYVASMNALIAQSRTYSRSRLGALGDELDKGARRLGRMHVPKAAVADHAELTEAFAAAVTAIKAVYTMWDADPPGRDDALLDASEAAYARCDAALDPYRL
jgi:hypothetical protein